MERQKDKTGHVKRIHLQSYITKSFLDRFQITLLTFKNKALRDYNFILKLQVKCYN
jgi:hypothetical protein